MSTKSTKKQVLSLVVLTLIMGVLHSRCLADDGWMQQAPTRLGDGQVLSIAFSPDATFLAAVYRTNLSSELWEAQTVLYWDPQTQEHIATLNIGKDIQTIAFSPDGTLLAFGESGGGDNTILLWDVAGKNQVGVIHLPTTPIWGVSSIVFSPDGKTLASSAAGQNAIQLWDLQTQIQIGELPQSVSGGRSLAFSPDGRFLAVGGRHNDNHNIHMWDVSAQNQVGSFIGHLDGTDDLAFSPDGTILASAGGWEDKAVYLWYVQTQEQIGMLGGHSAHVGSISFSPDGSFLASTAFWDDSVYLWDVSNQQEVGRLTGHDASDFGWGDQVDISSDGRWLACGSENGVELWEANLSAPSPQTSAFGPIPRDGAMHNDTWVTLSWQSGIYAGSNDLYIADNFDDVNEGIEEAFLGNQIDTFSIVGLPGFSYPEGLIPGTTYYWRIDEVNDSDPNSPWQGPVWSFTIPPKKAFNPYPADGSESVEPNIVLGWEAGFSSVFHTVYVGDNLDNVINAVEGLLLTQTTYDPGILESGKTYYWRIDEFDGIETHKGDIWSFSTLAIGRN